MNYVPPSLLSPPLRACRREALRPLAHSSRACPTVDTRERFISLSPSRLSGPHSRREAHSSLSLPPSLDLFRDRENSIRLLPLQSGLRMETITENKVQILHTRQNVYLQCKCVESIGIPVLAKKQQALEHDNNNNNDDDERAALLKRTKYSYP